MLIVALAVATDVFKLFDYVIFMAEGQISYHGEVPALLCFTSLHFTSQSALFRVLLAHARVDGWCNSERMWKRIWSMN